MILRTSLITFYYYSEVWVGIAHPYPCIGRFPVKNWAVHWNDYSWYCFPASLGQVLGTELGFSRCMLLGWRLVRKLGSTWHTTCFSGPMQGCCPDAWLPCFQWLTLTWHPSNICLTSEWKLVLVLLGLLVLLSIWFQVKTGTNFTTTTTQLQMKLQTGEASTVFFTILKSQATKLLTAKPSTR